MQMGCFDNAPHIVWAVVLAAVVAEKFGFETFMDDRKH